MKKLICIFMALIMCLAMTACNNKGKAEELVDKAADALSVKWKTIYDDSPFNVGDDRHLEIKNTRIVYIKDTGIEELKDVECFVDFVLFSNYSGTAPYYTAIDAYDSVAVFKDGTVDCDLDVITVYTGVYGNDFAGLIDHIEDYGSDYNREITVKQ